MSQETIPPQYIKTRSSRGAFVRNPAYMEYIYKQQLAQKAAQAQKAIQESGIELRDPGTVTRTVSKALRGKSSVNGGHNAWQYNVVMANKQVRAGEITIEKYQQIIQKNDERYNKHRHDFSMRKARSAATTAESNRVKDQTARTIAAGKGIAFGSETDKGGVNIAQNSLASKGQVADFSRHDQAVPVNTTQQLQREGRYEVVTPDGKVRVFKDMETANKFIERTDANYQPVQTQQARTIPNNTIGFTSLFGDYLVGQNVQGAPEQPKEKPYDILSKATEDSLKALDDFSLWKPKDQGVAAAKTILDPLAGFTKATLATYATFANLGRQGYVGNFVRTITGQPIRTEPKTRDIDIPDTFVGKTTEDVISGKDPTKTASAYVQSRGVPNVIGELGEIGIGAGGGGKVAAKVLPIKLSRYNQPGVTIKSAEVSRKIKTPIGTPQVIVNEVKPAQISFGYGKYTKPIASKLGNRITLGDINLSKVTAEVTATTGKQTQRGVKLAADSTRFEQNVNRQLVSKIEGLPESEVEKAKIIDEIIDITTKPKEDTLISNKLGEETFSTVTKTEQPSFVDSLKREQSKLLNPIGTYEGSLSHQYFVLPKYLRQAGDVDLHAKSYDKAARQISNITPRITADEGREFIAKTNPLNRSAKTFVTDSKTGKSEKVIEILNPDEIDEKGISQIVEGDTLFGKKIPSKTYNVEEGKTFGRQRQLLKKGESIYSIQSTDEGLKLEPAPFRKQKDEADFFALAKSAQETEFKPGSAEYTRLGKLIDDYKSKLDFDVEDFLTKQKGVKEVDRVILRSDQSLIQKSAGSIGKSLGSAKTSLGTVKSLGGTSKLSIGSKSTSGKSLGTGKSTASPSVESVTIKSSPQSLGGKSSTSIGSSLGSLGGESLGSSLGGGRPPSSSTLSLSANITTPIPTRKTAVFGAVPDFKNTTKKTKGTKPKSHDFLGNTNVSSVWGFRTAKKDIDVGDKRTESLYRKNIKVTDKKIKSNWYNTKVIKKKPFLSL